MGVWGLLSFVQMSNPPLGQHISLSDLGRETAAASTGGRGPTVKNDNRAPVLIVDGYALAHHLFTRCEECCWWDGGELRDYANTVREWVKEIQGCGLRIRCVLDGMLEPIKEGTAVQRGRENATKVDMALSKLRASNGDLPSQGLEGFVLPLGCIEVMADALLAEGVPVRRALYEADAELARECSAHRAVGVVSNDSDFLCLGVPLIPLNELRVSHGSVTAVVYMPQALADALSLPLCALPVLACLCGNDYVPKESLHTMHNAMAPANKPNRAWFVIRAVASALAPVYGQPTPPSPDELVGFLRSLLSQSYSGGADVEDILTSLHTALPRYSVHVHAPDEVAATSRDSDTARSTNARARAQGHVAQERAATIPPIGTCISPSALPHVQVRDVHGGIDAAQSNMDARDECAREVDDLEADLAHMRITPNLVQQQRHGWAWMRSVVEHIPNNTKEPITGAAPCEASAFARAAKIRASAYALMRGMRRGTPLEDGVAEWLPLAGTFRKTLVKVRASEDAVGCRQRSLEERRRIVFKVCEASLGSAGAGLKAVATLPDDAVLVALSLRLLAASEPHPSYSKRIICSLAVAATLPTEGYAAWRASHGHAKWRGRRDLALVNASAALIAMLMAVNDVNDALARPFPRQGYADAACPRLVHEVCLGAGGWTEALKSMQGIPEAVRGVWAGRAEMVVAAVCEGLPDDMWVEGKKAKKKRKAVSAGDLVKAKGKISGGASGAARARGAVGNPFSLLIDGDSD